MYQRAIASQPSYVSAHSAFGGFLFGQGRFREAIVSYERMTVLTPDNPARPLAGGLWIADPIDGTRAFVNGTDEWGVAVALAHHILSGRQNVRAAVRRPA